MPSESSFFKRLFTTSEPKEPTLAELAVIQYSRPTAGFAIPGQEEGFHWALVALPERHKNLRGTLWQARNDIRPRTECTHDYYQILYAYIPTDLYFTLEDSPAEIEWRLEVKDDIDLEQSSKPQCLGGVCIGKIETAQLSDLRQVCTAMKVQLKDEVDNIFTGVEQYCCRQRL